jgi:AP endonuclease 1
MPAAKRKASAVTESPKSSKRAQLNTKPKVTEEILKSPRPRRAATKIVTNIKDETDEEVEAKKTPKKAKDKSSKAIESKKLEKKDVKVDVDITDNEESSTKRKRKTKEEKETESMPLAARTQGLRMFVGAHVSGAGGVQNSIHNVLHIGGNAFALFLKSQRKWDNPPLQNGHRDQFTHLCKEHTFAADKHVLPHGSYLVNLAQAEAEKANQAYKSFIDDLKRCESLGVKLYNFHPGNTGSHPRNEAISRIAQALNKAHKETQTVVPVLETMAGGGNSIGSTFEDLRDIIKEVEDKARVGVCLDTCHVFAAGYDLRSPEAFQKTMDEFDKIVGIKYLRALHLNDSKAPFNSHRDLHQNIGLGFLGLRAFHNVMNESRFEGLPMVLETPIDRKAANGKPVEDKGIWAREIKLLESLIGMDPESKEFSKLESDLSKQGAEEREKLQASADKKAAKEKKGAKGRK